MKKPEKKLKKIHSLRHQITAYFIGLLFLSILTITVINGAFLEKYYVTKKIDVLLDLRTTLENTDIDKMMNSDSSEGSESIPDEIQRACSRNNLSWVIIDSSNTSWLSWGENEKMLQSKLFGYVYDLDEDGDKSRTLKQGDNYTIQQSHDRFAGMDYVECWGQLDDEHYFIIRATAANSQIRAFAAVTTDMVETARKDHNTSPVATAALGRLLTGGAMMGAMMKGEKDLLTLRIHAGGPLQGITVTADSHGNVKGYVGNPDVCIPANSKGKLDVAGAVGVGFMDVIKDMGLKEPYVGQVALQTSEIAEDLTYYFATSEQVPSAVGLGVLMNKDNTVRQAGGFIVQLMPFAEEEVIAKLEENVSKIDSVTSLLEQGHTPESLLEKVLEGFDIEINDDDAEKIVTVQDAVDQIKNVLD